MCKVRESLFCISHALRFTYLIFFFRLGWLGIVTSLHWDRGYSTHNYSANFFEICICDLSREKRLTLNLRTLFKAQAREHLLRWFSFIVLIFSFLSFEGKFKKSFSHLLLENWQLSFSHLTFDLALAVFSKTTAYFSLRSYSQV